jgi:phosphopantothenoylcysteine decarboxylase/phosphopantothenate--cysteine ligase
MLEPDEICREIPGIFGAGPLQGFKVLVSAGPTREPIDPVRFIGNRSSGKMGYALAAAARRAGADVTLVSGPSPLPAPPHIAFVAVETADEMYRAVLDRIAGQDIYIGAAAIADYRPERVEPMKIKKHREELSLTLVRTPDILKAVAASSPRPFVVGFAAETENLEQHARAKLAGKGADMIAANRVGDETGGFERDENALHVLWRDGESRLPLAAKSRIAEQLIDLIIDRYHASYTDQDP